MKFEWRCECKHLNKTEMKHWKIVRDGQGFVVDCVKCEREMDIDIIIEVNSVYK